MDQFNPEKTVELLTNWLKEVCTNYPAKGFTLGLSGGIDSAVCASIAIKTGLPVSLLLLPSENTPSSDIEDAMQLADMFDTPYQIISITPMYKAFKQSESLFNNADYNRRNVIKGNAQARIRMTLLYGHAQQYNHIVLGTDNACEWYMGYFTKFGDGGVDIVPLSNLNKHEVYALGEYLGVPKNILKKDPSAGLWMGQTDEDEMGVTYKEIDSYLNGNPISKSGLDKIKFWHNRSHHKREMPLSPPSTTFNATDI